MILLSFRFVCIFDKLLSYRKSKPFKFDPKYWKNCLNIETEMEFSLLSVLMVGDVRMRNANVMSNTWIVRKYEYIHMVKWWVEIFLVSRTNTFGTNKAKQVYEKVAKRKKKWIPFIWYIYLLWCFVLIRYCVILLCILSFSKGKCSKDAFFKDNCRGRLRWQGGR